MNSLAIALMLAAAALPALGQAYRWTDRDGSVRYTDTPPPPSARNVRKLKIGMTPADRAAGAARQLVEAAQKAPLRLYSSPTCADPCALARAALNERGAPFQEVQVWNSETNEELKRVSGAAQVPVLLVGDGPVVKGFDKEAFDQALHAAGYPKVGEVPRGALGAPPAPEGYVPPQERPKLDAEEPARPR